jgi:hypothetical protein
MLYTYILLQLRDKSYISFERLLQFQDHKLSHDSVNPPTISILTHVVITDCRKFIITNWGDF